LEDILEIYANSLGSYSIGVYFNFFYANSLGSYSVGAYFNFSYADSLGSYSIGAHFSFCLRLEIYVCIAFGVVLFFIFSFFMRLAVHAATVMSSRSCFCSLGAIWMHDNIVYMHTNGITNFF
jgi:hypothetical protein